MTSVHDPRDPRIYAKECKSLARAGYRVTLVAATTAGQESSDVELVGVGEPGPRSVRMTRTAARVYRRASALAADIYHFHDPELIPWGLLLAKSGKPVVYDIHEDYVTSIRQKSWLPGPLRAAAAHAFRRIEDAASKRFACVIAEFYYAERFPDAVPVLNYPVLDPALAAASGCDPASRRLLYTGGVTVDRGAYNHARLLAARPDLEVHLIGRCAGQLAGELRGLAGSAAPRLRIEGEGYYVDPERIRAAYRGGGWLAGLALFPESEHYRRKALTKFFEYMMAGLPIVCSGFPEWRAMIDRVGCGLAVDPAAPDEAIAAIAFLEQNPAAARAMGERGRQAVLSEYNWDRESDKLQRLYARLLDDRAPRGG